MLKVDVAGREKADTGLRKFSASVEDLRPFWAQLGRGLADAGGRWPLRRRTGKLRKSLTWAGARLGPHGIFESDPTRLTFGSAVFYSRFHQFGTKRQRARPLIHVDPKQHTAQLATWLRDRAARSGLEVET